LRDHDPRHACRLYPADAVVSTEGWGWATLSALAWILAGLLVLAAMVAIPYVVIAGPMAFVHRLLMLRLFARPDVDPTAPSS
jgi:hypothetical protein